MGVNIFLAGFAYQNGHIPISGEAIAEAIRLNGASIEENLQAFKLGRLAACGKLPDLELTSHEEVAETLNDILDYRKAYLTEYQNEAYARRYENLVRKVEGAEQGTDSEQVTLAVARYYFKLLAYKDEYEVARLYSSDEYKKSLQDQFEGNYKLEFHLAPPLIAPVDKHSGLPRKMKFGSWIWTAFRLLARFRFLRGTALDPFGYTADRKLERKLIGEYEQLVDELIPQISSEKLNQITDILSLPEKIRGFGHIKARNAEMAATELKRLLALLSNSDPEPVKLIDPKAA
jgi:indolepyruvate ferredoxin oxidoreductase